MARSGQLTMYANIGRGAGTFGEETLRIREQTYVATEQDRRPTLLQTGPTFALKKLGKSYANTIARL